MSGEWVLLGVLRQARGLRGEIFADPLGTSPDRFQPGLAVWLFPKDAAEGRPAVVERSWTHNGRLVLKFESMNRRTEAEQIEQQEIRIPIEQRPPAPDGQVYLSDLLGYSVQTRDGQPLGEVRAWYDHGGPAVLEVVGDREILVPFVPQICVEVDSQARRMVVDLPDGLEDLNA